MKGFVITILSVSLIVVLIVLLMSLRNAQLSMERTLIEPLPLTYAAFLLDDVAYEFNSIVGPQIEFDKRNDSTRITITDKIHSKNHSTEISTYESFLINEVGARTASNISTNFTNLTNGEIKIFINEDYVYSSNYTANESLFTKSGGTNATEYNVSFTITAVRTTVTPINFNSSGTMNVTIYYTDLNGTGTEEGKVFPNQVNTFKVDYVGGSSMTVTIGQKNGNSGSLLMKTDGIGADTVWTVVLPRMNAEKKCGYEYDAIINYTQGPVSIVKRIGK